MVFEGMKEEISQQRCTVGAHWYTNNLPENRTSKANVDVVDKKVNSLQEKYVYPVDVLSVVQKVRKKMDRNEAFSFSIKNSFQKIMELLLSWACGRLVKRVEKSQLLT